MYHVYGYLKGLLAALFVGGAVIAQLRFDAADTLRAIATHRASDVLLIPTMTLALLDELKKPGARHDLSSLHTVISSGGRSPAYIWQEIFDCLKPDELTTGYGMTEVTASSTVTRPGDPMERLLGSNGRLRDVGRAKESYRYGGEQVLPSEAEHQLVTHPAVLQAHVVPVPDLRMGEVGLAYVVLRDTPAVTPEALIAFCAERLARFKVPPHVLPIRAEDIPGTPAGAPNTSMVVQPRP